MSFQAERMLVQIESVHTVFLPVCLPKVQKSQIFFKVVCSLYQCSQERSGKFFWNATFTNSARTRSLFHFTSSLWSVSYSNLVNTSTSDKTLFRSWEKRWERLVLSVLFFRLQLILKYTDSMPNYTLIVFLCALSISFV